VKDSVFVGNLIIFVISGLFGGKKGRFLANDGHASAEPAREALLFEIF
jgi:hypothetical protein